MGSEELLLEASKSAELCAALHSVAEAEINGENKYSALVCREISKIIVCRTYATPVLELCHLIVAAAETGTPKGRYEYFFWDSGVATTGSFKGYSHRVMDQYEGSFVQYHQTGLTLDYPNAPFVIHFSRMPVLSALLEFLLSALGYCDIDEPLQKMLQNPTQKSVSACASTLSKTLYGYLKDHLPTAQSQRKFRKILDHCHNDVSLIDDSFILDFWKSASVDDDKNTDFKTFASAFQASVRIIQAIDAAQDLNALNHTIPIGSEREQGEIDPDLLSQTLETIQEPVSTLEHLNTRPLDQVKFLNKQETGCLETLLDAGKVAPHLALSVLRSDTFKTAQARLTQALRRHAPLEELRAIIAEGPAETYSQRQQSYTNLIQHIDRVNLASLHALSAVRSQTTIELMLQLRPDLDYTRLTPHFHETEADNLVQLHTEQITRKFLDILHDPDSVGSDISDLLKEAQKSYAGLSRKGFKEDPATNPDLTEAFSKGATLLHGLSKDLQNFLEKSNAATQGDHFWESCFKDDCIEFQNQFSKIYGVA